jgi:hypothetical protein
MSLSAWSLPPAAAVQAAVTTEKECTFSRLSNMATAGNCERCSPGEASSGCLRWLQCTIHRTIHHYAERQDMQSVAKEIVLKGA